MAATLNVNEIMMDTLDAFKTMVPQLSAFSTDFSSATAVKDTQIIAHIGSLPTVQTYSAGAGGFKNGATAADSLLEDVPVTLDQFVHVPIKIAYLTQLASKKALYVEAIKNYAYVLAKYVVDTALNKVVAANFTHSAVESIANTTLDTLEIRVRTALNAQKAYPTGRFGLVNSDFAAALQSDQRVASALFYGQLNGGSGYRKWTNLAGFENIWEYPDFPANGQSLSGFFGDRRAVVVAARLPNVGQADIVGLGIPQVARFDTITDSETGLTLLGISWQEQGTFDTYLTVTFLFGVSAGAQGGGADVKTDKAGYRVTTA